MENNVNNRFWLLAGLLILSQQSMASGEEGTGLNITLTIDENHRIIVQAESNNAFIIGQGTPETDYSELALDAIQQNQLTPHWGKAEVLLDCGFADVVVYQKVDEVWVETEVTRVMVDYCSH